MVNFVWYILYFYFSTWANYVSRFKIQKEFSLWWSTDRLLCAVGDLHVCPFRICIHTSPSFVLLCPKFLINRSLVKFWETDRQREREMYLCIGVLKLIEWLMFFAVGLFVEFFYRTNHFEDYILERTAMPDELIRKASGQTAFQEEQPFVSPSASTCRYATSMSSIQCYAIEQGWPHCRFSSRICSSQKV